MRLILTSFDSVASATDWIKTLQRLKASCLRGDANPDLSHQSGSTRLSIKLNLSTKADALNPSAKQTHSYLIFLIISMIRTVLAGGLNYGLNILQ